MCSKIKVGPQSIAISDYTYDLPDGRIAKYPLEKRDESKLLVYRSGDIAEKKFHQLPDLLNQNDCLVFNDTRVIHARVQFQRKTGAQIEILCLEPISPFEVTEAFCATEAVTWKAMVGNGKRWKQGEILTRTIAVENDSYKLNVELLGKESDSFQVKFSWSSGKAFSEVLSEVGTLPLPPYLNRDTEDEDEERYQTVYAQADGSVAAPTAGLHFTKDVFGNLKKRGVQSLFVTLHVGAGTFKPVKSETMEGHEMHQERIEVSKNTIEQMLKAVETRNRIIPVGTTSLRTIESLYWFGAKLSLGHKMKELFVSQWEPYELDITKIDAKTSLRAILNWMICERKPYVSGATQLLIAPGYEIKLADALVTNFHQPSSTLLLLVASLVGEKWRNLYDYALENDFRFLSFGDSSILFRS